MTMSASSFPICPICKSKSIITLGQPQINVQIYEMIQRKYQIVKCSFCQYYFVFPKISFTEQEWEKLYSMEYFGQSATWWQERSCLDIKRRLNLLHHHVEKKPSIKFLEIGSGEGFVLIDSLARGWETYGIDISDNRVAKARNKSINFYKKNIFEAGFLNEYFDCVYINSVLEHILDPFSVLHEIFRIMKKNGILYIALPNEGCFFNDFKQLLFSILGKNRYSAYLQPFKRPYHVIGFTQKSLTKLLNKNGFDIVHFRTFGGIHEWKKFKCFTKPFFINLILLPIHLIAKPLKKQIYMDVIVRKGVVSGRG